MKRLQRFMAINNSKVSKSSVSNVFETEAKSNAAAISQDAGKGAIKPPTLVAGKSTSGLNALGLEQQIQNAGNGGQALQQPVKSFMENRLGRRFDDVSIHTGARSSDLNRTMQSKAFTIGNQIHFAENRFQPGTQEGQQLLAHELTHTMQQQNASVIQKDEDGNSTGTDFDFELLPPHIQLTLPHFLLDADTDRVRTQFTWNDLQTSLQYSYGSSIDLGLRYRTFSTQIGFDPSSSVLNYSARFNLPSSLALSGTGSYNFTDNAATLGLSGSYRGFRLGGNYNFGTSSLGLSFGYGAPLLPTPDEMGSTFGAAGSAIPPLIGSVPGVMPDPMAWYQAQQERISAVTQGVAMFNKLREEPNSGIRFGVAGRLTYNPTSGLFIFVGARGSF